MKTKDQNYLRVKLLEDIPDGMGMKFKKGSIIGVTKKKFKELVDGKKATPSKALSDKAIRI